MNQVFLKKSKIPLSAKELADEANAITQNNPFRMFDFDERNPLCRIKGNHCNCCENGKFELLPITDSDVIQGGKRYMICRVCGCYSHL